MIAAIEKQVLIDAPVAAVWESLTDLSIMKQWMGAEELKLEIETSWVPGSSFSIRGVHHLQFENKGTVLENIPGQLLSYDFLSSLSRLPDIKENHTVISFSLVPTEAGTRLNLTISNFPTETIYQHLNFYWNTTLVMLKRRVEELIY